VLTQAEADALIAMDKRFAHPTTIALLPGSDQTHELVGVDDHERFLLDLWRGTFRLSKTRYQTRGRKVIVLVRLDIDGAPHTNPDGQQLGGTHIHVYREGYEDRWAFPLHATQFAGTDDMQRTFREFCDYCRIQNPPAWQGGLP